MKKIIVSVEGQTEESFVNDPLKSYLRKLNKDIKQEISLLLKTNPESVITTMYDYYRYPKDSPGYGKLEQISSSIEKVNHLEKEFQKDFNTDRLIPFLMLHEFETYLFASPQEFDRVFPTENASSKIDDIKRQYDSPEDIDDGDYTHPARRIKDIIPKFNKRLWGTMIIRKTGIGRIREECPHFNEWLAKLESL